jgi:hypothetical protein
MSIPEFYVRVIRQRRRLASDPMFHNNHTMGHKNLPKQEILLQQKMRTNLLPDQPHSISFTGSISRYGK